MHYRRPRRHEKTFQELKSHAEGDKRNSTGMSNFPSAEKQSHFRMNSSGLKRVRPRQGSHSLVIPIKLLLGAPIMVAAILIGCCYSF